MSGFFENVFIDIPDYEEQLFLVNEYEKLNLYENKLNCVKNKIEKLLEKTIAW